MNWGPHAKQTSPGGPNEPSPALQRWVKRNNDASPGGTTDFSLMPGGRPLQSQQRIPKQQVSPTHILRLDRSLRLHQRVTQRRSTLEERLHQTAIQMSLRLRVRERRRRNNRHRSALTIQQQRLRQALRVDVVEEPVQTIKSQEHRKPRSIGQR